METSEVSPDATATITEQLTAEIKSVGEILGAASLNIPSYQRPYTWGIRNVDQLVSDIRRFMRAGHYRIGTFILNPQLSEHPSGRICAAESTMDIVDGQQRFLTFALINHALSEHSATIDEDLLAELHLGIDRISIPVRKDGRSERNLRENFVHLKRVISRWSPEELKRFTEFFLKQCSVVVLIVRDLDSAFQMFDSQNTRGRELFPTDLLKAYHLREFGRTNSSRESMLDTVSAWEAVPPEEINHVIAGVLFPIKQWTANSSVPRQGFTSEHIGHFKGIREGATGNGQFRWAHPVLMAKATADRFLQENSTLLRHGVVNELEFPFQLTSPIIDGEMFFRMVHHYVGETRRAGVQWAQDEVSTDSPLRGDSQLDSVFEILGEQSTGTGNRYVRELFDCLLIAYLDRFGWYEVESAAIALAQYAYLIRVHLQRVQISSVDLHARNVHHRVDDDDGNLFASIARALDPEIILSRPEPRLAEEITVPQTLLSLYPAAIDAQGKEGQR